MLGGRASSFVDAQTGEILDECQHGTMRCCTNLADLLDRLSVHHLIRYFDALQFLDGAGRRSEISRCFLPAPLHTSLSFLAFRSLGLSDKLAIARAMLGMLRAVADPKWDLVDVAAWFAEQRQTENAIKRFWRPVLVSACNEDLDRISCTHAFKIFRDGFLANSTGYQFGVPRVPLGVLYTDPTIKYLESRGGSIRLRTIVEAIDFDDSASRRISGIILRSGERLMADHYISALQVDLLLKLLPLEITSGEAYWEQLNGIELTPIMGVHLWFDRLVECPPALAILDRSIEWIFNKTVNFDVPFTAPQSDAIEDAGAQQAVTEAGTYLSLVVSASRSYTDMPASAIVETALRDVEACLPAVREATLLRSRVIRWPKATFSPAPGVDGLRPDQRSPISNMKVAGEWTQTGWPSTMESAARSGYRAAECVLADAGVARPLVAPDLPVGWLTKLLGRGF